MPAIPAGQRIYAIGDIHGRLDLFDTVLALVRADAAGCRLAVHVILLGDLIDRGPESAGVVARAMQPLDFAAMTVLRGNHEMAMLDALDGNDAAFRMWLRNGGDTALASWGMDQRDIDTADIASLVDIARALIPPEQIAWIAACPFQIAIGGYYFVHAGIRPGIALTRQNSADQLWIREPFLNSRRQHEAMIVHGHSISPEVEDRPNRIGIDTGAYLTGRLTALVLEGTGRRILQS